MNLRVPPQSVEAEQALVGGMMLVPVERQAEVFDELDLDEADFYRRDHQMIWRAIGDLIDRRQPIDAVTVGEWFEHIDRAHDVGGGAYLIQLASTTPSAANIAAYAKIVKAKAKLRRLIEAGTEIVNAGFEGGEPDELIGQAQTRIAGLLDDAPCDLESVASIAPRVFDAVRERALKGEVMEGPATGLTDLDRLLNGLKPTDLIILAARPSMGKSTLALNIAEALGVRQDTAVAVFNFEMSAESCVQRMACSMAGIDHDKVRKGQLDDEEWRRFNEAITRVREAPLFFSKPANVRVETILAQARRLHAQHPVGLIVIDYLQLIDMAGAENKTQGVTEASRKLKMLAVELNVPVLVLSQLNRSLETRADKRPVMSDLRESGAIEQDADVIVFVYRDEVYHPHSPDAGTAELIVAKQRNGPTGTVRVASRLHLCRFDDLDHGWMARQHDQRKSAQQRRADRWGAVVPDD